MADLKTELRYMLMGSSYDEMKKIIDDPILRAIKNNEIMKIERGNRKPSVLTFSDLDLMKLGNGAVYFNNDTYNYLKSSIISLNEEVAKLVEATSLSQRGHYNEQQAWMNSVLAINLELLEFMKASINDYHVVIFKGVNDFSELTILPFYCNLIFIPKYINIESSTLNYMKAESMPLKYPIHNTRGSATYIYSLVQPVELLQCVSAMSAMNMVKFNNKNLTTYLQNFEVPYKKYNFLVAIINQFNKYQTTGLLFTNRNDKTIQSAILSGNVLKAMETQAAFLKPNGLDFAAPTPVASGNFYADTRSIADQVDIPKHLKDFLWLFTMGKLKQGDVVTSTVAKYFAYPETTTQIYNRIMALASTANPPVKPPFVAEILGSDWTKEGLPTGDMVLNVLKTVLSEADTFYQIINPSGVGQGYP